MKTFNRVLVSACIILLMIAAIFLRKDYIAESTAEIEIQRFGFVPVTFMGVTIKMKSGSHDYYLKQIGGDSLFVHIVASDDLTSNFTRENYLYFTKGSIKSLSWEIPNGKYVPIKKTVVQTK